MVEHAGAGCVLSLVIVAVFAVLLHEKEGTPMLPSVAAKATREVEDPANRITPVPPAPAIEAAAIPPASSAVATAAPVEPLAVAVLPAKAPAERRETPRPREADRRVQLVGSRVELAPAPRKSAPAVAPRKARASFVEVREGERLVDVAERVYGSPEAVEALLRANRDQVSGRDDPVEAGTWLRTP